MRISRHMQIFLKGLAGALALAAFFIWALPFIAAQRWRLCEFLPIAQASFGTTSPQLLYDGSDAVIVGTATSSKVQRAAPQPWSDDGCRLITVYEVTVEKIVAQHGPNEIPKHLRLQIEGGSTPLYSTIVGDQAMLAANERFAAFIGLESHGRFAIRGGALGKFRILADGTLGADEMEKHLASWVFGKPMTMTELEAFPFGRGVSEDDAKKPLFFTHEVRPDLTITIPSDMQFHFGDGTDGFEAQSVEWGDGTYFVGWHIMNSGDYAQALADFRANDALIDTGEYWQGCFNGHAFARKDGTPEEHRVAKCGDHVLTFSIPPMPPEQFERVGQVLGSFRLE